MDVEKITPGDKASVGSIRLEGEDYWCRELCTYYPYGLNDNVRGVGNNIQTAWIVSECIVNPRRACAVRVMVLVLSVCLSVCYHVFCLYAQQGNEIVTRGGLLLQQLHF